MVERLSSCGCSLAFTLYFVFYRFFSFKDSVGATLFAKFVCLTLVAHAHVLLSLFICISHFLQINEDDDIPYRPQGIEVGFVVWCFCLYPSCSGGSLFHTFMTKRKRIKIR